MDSVDLNEVETKKLRLLWIIDSRSENRTCQSGRVLHDLYYFSKQLGRSGYAGNETFYLDGLSK